MFILPVNLHSVQKDFVISVTNANVSPGELQCTRRIDERHRHFSAEADKHFC